MGYYTSFELKWEADPELSEKISNYLELNENVYYGFDRNGTPGDDVKWYSYDKDMIELSLIFPEVLFELTGHGEESGDIWKAYYKNGKTQYVEAEIVFPEPDWSALE